MRGTLYGVGVGPGDPELITIKAVNRIQECDLIGIPAKSAKSCTAYQIVRQAVPGITDKPILCIPIPMTTDRTRLEAAYEEGSRKLMEQLEAGKQIAFLNLGDPAIYGTYLRIHEKIQKAGYEVKLISGVPSFCAVAAELGIPLASGDEKIHILPGCCLADETEDYDGTRVLMKSGGRMEEVKKRLMELEALGKAKSYAVINCGMENQDICRNIGDLDEKAGYFTTIIVKEGP